MIIERKTPKDFISSIFNERMFQQANKITSFTNKAILLIEGKLNNGVEYLKNKNSIYGAFINFSIKL